MPRRQTPSHQRVACKPDVVPRLLSPLPWPRLLSDRRTAAPSAYPVESAETAKPGFGHRGTTLRRRCLIPSVVAGPRPRISRCHRGVKKMGKSLFSLVLLSAVSVQSTVVLADPVGDAVVAGVVGGLLGGLIGPPPPPLAPRPWHEPYPWPGPPGFAPPGRYGPPGYGGPPWFLAGPGRGGQPYYGRGAGRAGRPPHGGVPGRGGQPPIGGGPGRGGGPGGGP